VWGDRLWAQWFDPPFDTRGDGVLAGVLAGGMALGGAHVLSLQLDAVLAAGEGAFLALFAGALLGGTLGLPLLAASRSLARRSITPRAMRVAVGLLMLALGGAAYAFVARPILLTPPEQYAGTAGNSYERIHRRGGEVVRREPLSGTQVSVEKWAEAAGGSSSAVITFGLLALFPLTMGLLAWPPQGTLAQDAPPPPLRDEDPAWLRVLLGRCPSCDRRVIERWRRCPSCQALLPSAYRHRRDAEEALTFLAWLGLAVSGFMALAATVFYLQGEGPVWVLSAAAVFFLGAHACLKWWAWALLPVRLAWPALALAILFVLWPTPLMALLVASLPLAVSLKLALIGGRLSAYVDGTLERDAGEDAPTDLLTGDQCRRCGERGASIVAPMWCVSMVFITSRYPGPPHLLCPFHARVAALPATLTSALAGWWGIPSGLLWTPVVLWQNLADGGVHLDRQAALEQLAAEREGPLSIGWRDIATFAVVFLLLFLVARFV
jgi:hypothetical protein